jgi:hypothetical protein
MTLTEPFNATGEGFTVHRPCDGAPVHVIAALPLTPAGAVSTSEYVADVPLVTVTEVVLLAINVKSMPVPESAAVCRPLGASSTSVKEPVRAPPTVGANTISIVQAVFGLKVAPQLVEAT